MTILNPKRIRDYPRLMLVTTWLILGINLIFHQGWIGAFGQLIGQDFLSFYSAGIIYGEHPSLIYDSQAQIDVQQTLLAPTVSAGYIPYLNPPYVAPFFHLWSLLPLHWSLLFWSILAIFSVFLSIYLLMKLIPSGKKYPAISYTQLVVLTLSFFPFIEGLQAGQNHWITLFLVSLIVYSMLKEKWYLAGIAAGFLLYKPQFLIGFLIIWIVWKNYKALFSFGLVAIVWIGLFALQNGKGLLLAYLKLSQTFMSLPFLSGFPRYILVTLYGFLVSFFPQSAQPILTALTTFILIIGGLGLAWLAFKLRHYSIKDRIPAIAAAIILPLLVAPHTLLHDLVILIPVFVLLSIYLQSSHQLLIISAIVYFGAILLIPLGALTNIAWVSLLVIFIVAIFIYWLITKRKIIFAE